MSKNSYFTCRGAYCYHCVTCCVRQTSNYSYVCYIKTTSNILITIFSFSYTLITIVRYQILLTVRYSKILGDTAHSPPAHIPMSWCMSLVCSCFGQTYDTKS